MQDTTEPIVGRLAELRWLRHRLDQAAGGEPQCVLIQGEPGIGKTRLAHEVRRYAVDAGFEPLVGRAYEDVQLPFLPWRDDVLPALVHHCEVTGRPRPDALMTDLPAAADPRAHGGSPELAARALLELAALLLDAAARAPRFVLLDDLHWADAPSIDLVRHVVYRLAGRLPPTHLLLVATARHSPAVEPLAREHHCAVLELQGLDALAAADLARRLGARHALPDALLAASGGNPLAIAAAVQSGATGPRAGNSVEADLAPLSDECREILAWAALLGPDASRATLAATAQWDAAALDASLRLALATGILVDDGSRLEFARADVRRRCLALLDPIARRRAHAVAATVLGPAQGPQVLSVARHLVGAGPEADPAEVALVTAAAGHEAMRLCAWEDAAEMFGASIAAEGRLGHGDATDAEARADLADRHVLAGKCRLHALDAESAHEHFEAAAQLSASIGDEPGELRARSEQLLARIAAGPVSRHDVEPVARLADRLADQTPDLGAEALVDVSQAEWTQLRIDAARATIDRALELSVPRGLHVAAERAYVSRAVTDWMTLDLPAALESLRHADEHAIAANDPIRRIGPVYRRPLTLLWMGRLADAERACDEAADLSEAVRSQYEYVLVLATRVAIAALRGDQAAAEDLAEHALRLQRLSGYRWAAGLYLPVLALTHVERGDPVRAEAALAEWERTADDLSRIPLRLLRDVVAVRAGQAGAETLGRVPGLPSTPMLGAQDWAILTVELATRLDEPDAAIEPVALIEATLDRGMRISSSLGRSLERAAADGHALLGCTDEARARYEAAIELADCAGTTLEGAFARLGLARLLAGDDRARAAQLLRAALPTLEDLQLVAALREADELARDLGTDLEHSAASDAAPIAQTATILFFDVVDSTRLTEELGDVAYWQRARALETRLRAVVAQAGGTTLPGVNVGDGLIALFDSAAATVEAALNSLEAVHPTGLHLHVGVHHGPVLRRNDTLYGSTVNFAARVCAASGRDEILVSQPARDQVGEALAGAVAFVDRGMHDLKGLGAPQHLYAAVPST